MLFKIVALLLLFSVNFVIIVVTFITVYTFVIIVVTFIIVYTFVIIVVTFAMQQMVSSFCIVVGQLIRFWDCFIGDQ